MFCSCWCTSWAWKLLLNVGKCSFQAHFFTQHRQGKSNLRWMEKGWSENVLPCSLLCIIMYHLFQCPVLSFTPYPVPATCSVWPAWTQTHCPLWPLCSWTSCFTLEGKTFYYFIKALKAFCMFCMLPGFHSITENIRTASLYSLLIKCRMLPKRDKTEI